MHRVFPPSEPPDGGRPQSFRLVVVGGTQLHRSWYLLAIVRRGLLVIDAAKDELLKTVNNEGEGSYNSIVQAKDGSICPSPGAMLPSVVPCSPKLPCITKTSI